MESIYSYNRDQKCKAKHGEGSVSIYRIKPKTQSSTDAIALSLLTQNVLHLDIPHCHGKNFGVLACAWDAPMPG